MRDSLITGVVSGAAAGAAGGLVLDKGEGAAKGAAIGALVGGVAAYFIHNSLEDRDSKVRKETLFNLDKYNVSQPTANRMEGDYGLSAPAVETQCYDTQVKGSKLVQAHCESVIVGTPEWVSNPNKSKKQNNE